MASSERVERTIKGLQRVKTWQLFLLLILLLFVAATFLRLNNVGMEQRRNAVIAADKGGNDAQIAQSLYNLQQYVTSHMNTDLGKGVYLQYSNQRANQALLSSASSSDNPNGNVYKKAQEVCAPQFQYYDFAYVDCTLAQLAKYPGADKLVSGVNLPAPSIYTHNYVSPVWSPDFAGWSVIACIVIALIIVIRLVTLVILRLILQLRYRSL